MNTINFDSLLKAIIAMLIINTSLILADRTINYCIIKEYNSRDMHDNYFPNYNIIITQIPEKQSSNIDTDSIIFPEISDFINFDYLYIRIYQTGSGYFEEDYKGIPQNKFLGKYCTHPGNVFLSFSMPFIYWNLGYVCEFEALFPNRAVSAKFSFFDNGYAAYNAYKSLNPSETSSGFSLDGQFRKNKATIKVNADDQIGYIRVNGTPINIGSDPSLSNPSALKSFNFDIQPLDIISIGATDTGGSFGLAAEIDYTDPFGKTYFLATNTGGSWICGSKVGVAPSSPNAGIVTVGFTHSPASIWDTDKNSSSQTIECSIVIPPYNFPCLF